MTQSSIDSQAEPTGDARVDGVVARLGDLDDLDLPTQLEVFGDLQTSLAAILDSQHDLDLDPDDVPRSAS